MDCGNEKNIERDKIPLLKKQFEFMENSACLFDIGKRNEAVRIALAIRVLMHDTKYSTSLFKYVKIKNSIEILSTKNTSYKFGESDAEGVTLTGLGFFGEPPTLKISANLHRYSMCKKLTVKNWWEEEVIYLKDLGSFSRKDLCLTAANKNGGAHVDELPEMYERLQNGDTNFNFEYNDGKVNFDELWPYTLRQFAWEILNSDDVMVIRSFE